MRALIVVFLAGAFFTPAAAGVEEPVTAHAEDFFECPDEPSGAWVHPLVWPYAICGIYARANWTVEACGPSTCTVRVDTHSNAWALYPGLLHVETNAAPGGGSACLGPKPVSDRLREEIPCGRVCQTVTVSWTASCTGSLTATVEVAPGTCTIFHVTEAFTVDGGAMGGGNVFWFAYVCRDSGEGAPFFVVR